MTTSYVLVDFENVQPDMSALAGMPFKVVVFFGAKQQEGRVQARTMLSLYKLGSNLEIVELLHSGKNALDMHIAWWLGRIFERESDAIAHVISRDTDFDPLIAYLKTRGFQVSREKDVSALARTSPAPQPTKKSKQPAPAAKKGPAAKPIPKAADDGLARFLKQLQSMSGKPSTRRKLEQTLAAFFKHHGGERSGKDIEQQVDELIRRKLVIQAGTKVTYALV
jgi:hypothetical protein